jgi:hypothetical protein
MNVIVNVGSNMSNTNTNTNNVIANQGALSSCIINYNDWNYYYGKFVFVLRAHL